MRAPLLALALLLGIASTASAGERTLTLYSPAITVAPYTAKQEYVPLKPDGVEAPNSTDFITRMDADVVDRRDPNAASLPIQDVMVHHLVYIGLNSAGSCGGRFFARGEERQILDLPDGYGLPNRNPGSAGAPPWFLTHMLMNHRSRAKTVYVRVRVTMSDEALKPVETWWIDTRQCDPDPVIDIPGGGGRGSTFVDRQEWTAPFSGRIVQAGGHLHGGGKFSRLRDLSCGGRTLVNSRAYYGGPRHSFYRVRPILHEPSPIRIGQLRSAAGIPVAAGDKLLLEGGYDNAIPHTRVMNIKVAYVTRDSSVVGCPPFPNDIELTNKPKTFRAQPPRFVVPLVRSPRGAFRPLGSALDVRDYFFRQEKIRVRAGQTVTWRFDSRDQHSVAVANGPRGFSSPWLAFGAQFTYTPKVRGTYNLFCSLHPATMVQELDVR